MVEVMEQVRRTVCGGGSSMFSAGVILAYVLCTLHHFVTMAACKRLQLSVNVATLPTDRPPCFLLGSEFSNCCPRTVEGFNMIIDRYHSKQS